MQIRFRTKILLALILCVVAVLAAGLATVNRAFARQINDLTIERVAQGKRNFDGQIQRINEKLTHDAYLLALVPRIQEAVDKSAGEVAGIVLNEMETRLMSPDFVVVTDRNGAPLVRLLSRSGKFETIAHAPSGDPEHALVMKAIGSVDPQDGFVVAEGCLIQVVAVQSLLGDNIRLVIVLGSAITDTSARLIQYLQAEHDHAGYVVDGRVMASSLAPALRDSLTGQLTSEGTYEISLEGRSYRVGLRAVSRSDSPRPLFTAVFISLEKLLRAREKMAREVVIAGAAGIGIAVVLGLAISRGVTAPVVDLVEGTERVARGEYSYRIVVRTRDELGGLALAFNKMAGDLATKEKMRAVLNKVVAPEVAEELLKSDLHLGGDLVRATLLFADLRGFTSLTQGMPPTKIVAMLNEFMTEMHQEVLACSGIIDKYVGDEIIALFGVPRALGHDAFAAVEAAHRMRERLVVLNARRAERGDGPLAMGIGIHTGEVVAGRMGSEQQLNYTCIGEAVNLASRLCSNAKAGQILISHDTLKEAGEKVDVRLLEPITVKGFSKPVAIYEVERVEIGETGRRRKEVTA